MKDGDKEMRLATKLVAQLVARLVTSFRLPTILWVWNIVKMNIISQIEHTMAAESNAKIQFYQVDI